MKRDDTIDRAAVARNPFVPQGTPSSPQREGAPTMKSRRGGATDLTVRYIGVHLAAPADRMAVPDHMCDRGLALCVQCGNADVQSDDHLGHRSIQCAAGTRRIRRQHRH